jgi:hypothetical protein
MTIMLYPPVPVPLGGKIVTAPSVQLTIVASREPNSTRPPVGTVWPLGGAPKLRPVIVMGSPHVPPAGVKPVAIGADCGVAVAVGPGVLVAIGVSVGVAVAPSGANALNPDVMQGRSPSA